MTILMNWLALVPVPITILVMVYAVARWRELETGGDWVNGFNAPKFMISPSFWSAGAVIAGCIVVIAAMFAGPVSAQPTGSPGDHGDSVNDPRGTSGGSGRTGLNGDSVKGDDAQGMPGQQIKPKPSSSPVLRSSDTSSSATRPSGSSAAASALEPGLIILQALPVAPLPEPVESVVPEEPEAETRASAEPKSDEGMSFSSRLAIVAAVIGLGSGLLLLSSRSSGTSGRHSI